MNCIQAAVHHQIEQMKVRVPNAKPVLVIFGSGVGVYGDGCTQSRVTYNNQNYLEDVSKMFTLGKEYKGAQLPASQCANQLVKIVDNMSEEGMTALGPAVVFALGLCSGHPGSRVMVCTDGQANIGVGRVDVGKSELAQAQVADTYGKIAQIARDNGVTVSVLSIRAEDCCLEHLGKLADQTNGVVDIVNPMDLSKQVASVMSKPILGTGVTCKVIMNNNFTFVDSFSHKITKEIGNVTADSDFTFAFKQSKYLPDMKDVPIQVQINYSRPDGAQIHRIITRKVEISNDRDKVEENSRTAILAMHAIHTSAGLAQQGDYKGARVNLISVMRLLQRGMKTRQNQKEYISFIVQSEKLDGFMRHAQAQEAVLGKALADRDDTAAKNIVQMKQANFSLFAVPT